MRRRKKVPVYLVVYYALLVIASVIVLIPILWMLSASFDKVNSYALPYPPRFIPKNPSLFNYQLVMNNMDILKYMLNTIIVTILTLGVQLLFVPLAGFAFSKGRFPFKAVLLSLLLSSMMVPMETKLLPIFTLVRSMKLGDTYLGVILPTVMTGGYYIFLMKQGFDDLPNELLESATIDGANKVLAYLKIYLPLMGAPIATLSVLSVMATWNDLLWPMIIINSDDMTTIQMGLSLFSTGSEAMGRHAGMSTAASVISIIPLTLVFIFLQKYIVQSIAVSGMKQ